MDCFTLPLTDHKVVSSKLSSKALVATQLVATALLARTTHQLMRFKPQTSATNVARQRNYLKLNMSSLNPTHYGSLPCVHKMPDNLSLRLCGVYGMCIDIIVSECCIIVDYV